MSVGGGGRRFKQCLVDIEDGMISSHNNKYCAAELEETASVHRGQRPHMPCALCTLLYALASLAAELPYLCLLAIPLVSSDAFFIHRISGSGSPAILPRPGPFMAG